MTVLIQMIKYRYMKYKIGQILKIKNIDACGSARDSKAVYAKITMVTTANNYIYDLLDADKNKVNSCSFCFKDNDLEPINRPIEDVRYGDFITNGREKLRVLGRCDEVVFTEGFGRLQKTISWNISELKKHDVKIFQPELEEKPEEKQEKEEPEEITMHEASKQIFEILKRIKE